MDFRLSDEQALLRDTVRGLLSRNYDLEGWLKVIDSEPGWSLGAVSECRPTRPETD